jgi:uncharacterized membrane protein YccC
MSWRRRGITVLSGLAMLLAVDLVDRWLALAGLHAEATRFDDVLLGLVAAILVYFLQREQERELRRQRQSAVVIEQMNHHIRNALQVIVTRASLDQQVKPELRQIDDAVARIDWALREILPRSSADEPISGLKPETREAATFLLIGKGPPPG